MPNGAGAANPPDVQMVRTAMGLEHMLQPDMELVLLRAPGADGAAEQPGARRPEPHLRDDMRAFVQAVGMSMQHTTMAIGNLATTLPSRMPQIVVIEV